MPIYEKKCGRLVRCLSGLTLAALMSSGCVKDEIEVGKTACEARVPVSITVPVSSGGENPASKVTAVAGESNVGSLQVFVFRKDGVLDAYAKSSGKTASLDCTVGEKDFVAVVNAPDLQGVYSMQDLAGLSSRLSDNAVGNFVMTGTASSNITNAENAVSINVRRLVARICIKKVTNALTAQYSSTGLTLTRIYLSNVAGDRQYLSSSSPTLWLNKMGSRTDLPGLLCSDAISQVVETGKSYAVPHYFYCYPNPVSSDSSSSTWSPRFTRLVVEASILGKTYYYPVTLESVESNHIYDIEELTITRIGAVSPDSPVETGSVSLTVTVSEWESGTSSSVTI